MLLTVSFWWNLGDLSYLRAFLWYTLLYRKMLQNFELELLTYFGLLKGQGHEIRLKRHSLRDLGLDRVCLLFIIFPTAIKKLK
jgi:hypothetical protein